MNKMRVLLQAGLLTLIAAGSLQAAETVDQLQAIGGFQTADAVVIASSEQIAGVTVDCGASACTFSLYDGDALGDMSNANGRFEGGAAANTTAFLDLRDFPIRFATGVVLNVDGNQDAVTVFRVSPQ